MYQVGVYLSPVFNIINYAKTLKNVDLFDNSAILNHKISFCQLFGA